MGLLNLLVAVFHGQGLGGLDGLQGFLGKLIHVHGISTLLSGRVSPAPNCCLSLVYLFSGFFHELIVNN